MIVVQFPNNYYDNALAKLINYTSWSWSSACNLPVRKKCILRMRFADH